MKMNRLFLKFANKKQQQRRAGKSRSRSALAGSVALLAATFMPVLTSSAATYYWDSDANGANGITEGTGAFTFVPGTTATLYNNAAVDVVSASGDIIIFGNSSTLASSPTINVGTGTLGGLIFGSTTTNGYTLTNSGASTLTIGASGIVLNSGAQATTVGSANLSLALGAAESFVNNSASLLTVGGAINNGGFNLTLTSGSTGGQTLTGVISGAGGLTVNTNPGGSGVTTLTGANVYTGTTTVGAGGSLTLNFAGAGAPATNIINNTANSSSLTLAGGTLTLNGVAAGTNSQQFNGVTVNSGGSSFVATQNGATNLSASLGTITRNAGGTVAFTTLPTTGSITLGNANDASGILGPWAFVGTGTNTRYATVSGGAIASYAGATAGTAGTLANVTSATTNYSFGAAATLGAVATANTLQYTGAAATLALGANTLTLNGLLNTGSGTLTISGAGTIPVGSATDLVIAGPGSVAFSSAITGAGKGLTYSGTGTLTLGTTVSTYTGTTTVNSGTVTLGLASVLNSGSSLVVNGGTLGASTFNQAVAALTINGGTISSTTGTITSTATVSANGGTISAILAGAAGLTASSGTTILNGGTTANTYAGTTTINSGATLQLGNGGTGLATVLAAGGITNNGTLIFAPGTTGATYANVITQGAGGSLILNGNAAGVPAGVTLTATTSNIGGNIILNQGRLIITALTNLGNATTPIIINGTGTNGGQFWANAALAIANPITINNSPGSTEAAGNLGAIRGFNGVSYTGTMSLTSGVAAINPESGNTVTVSGLIQGAGTFIAGTVGNNRGGVVTLTGANNTYTGGTQVSGATLNANAAGVLGTGPVTLNNFSNTVFAQSTANALTGTNSLTINGGLATLSAANNYTGGTTLTGGTLTVTGALGLGTAGVGMSGGTFNANVANTLFSGSNAGVTYANNLTQTGGAFVTGTANAIQGAVTLNLSGGTTALNAAQAYTGGANISGTNVTSISAAFALSGTTTVSSGGTLSSSLAPTTAGTTNNSGGNIVLNSGGLLTSAAAGGSFWNVAANSGGIINPGGVGTIGTGPLTINGLTTASGSILQFDTASGNSADQLVVGNLPAGTYSFGSGTIVNPRSAGQLSTIPGTYSIINYGDGAAPAIGAGGLTTVAAPSGVTYTLSNSAGNVVLTISGTYAAIAAGWLPNTAGPNSWNNTANWSGGVIPQLSGDTANFSTTNAATQTVTVDGQQHVGAIVLNPTTSGYTITTGTVGSVIYLDNGASSAVINNAALNNTISAQINLLSANTNISAAAGTTLTLGNITGTGKLTVASGTGTVSLPTTATGSWTGGTEVDAGTLSFAGTYAANVTSLNNAGIGTVTLNGGTISFTNTTGTSANPTTGFVINVAAGGGTLNTGGATSGTGGKVNLQGLGFFTGSGTLTKTGGGDLQDGGPSLGFTGPVILSNNGLIEDQNVAALGFGTTAGFNGGSVTLNGPSGANAPELVSGGVQIFNPITLNGGTLSANGTNNGIFNSTVNVTAGSTLRASQFQGQTVAQNFAINTLTGSSALAVNGSTTANAIGLVTLGTASGYTGAITIGANAALGLGSGASFLGGTINNFTNATSGIGLVSDGTATPGTSTPETVSFVLPSQVTAGLFGAGNTTGYIVGKQGATTLSNQAANKTIAPTTALPFSTTNTLNVQALNGYGLLLANQPALTATTTFGTGTVASVGGVAPVNQLSNVIPALTLTNLTGAFNITKTGVSTLQLGTSASDASNTFGAGGAAGINITAGPVSAFADQNLGAATNGITLNNTTLAEFLALNSFATSRLVTIGAATGSTLGAANGATLTLNTGLAYGAAANTLTKAENGTVILTAAATGTPTSGTTINAGALQISNSNQIGSGAITVANNIGASLQLTGGATFTQAITVNNSGFQNRGSIENVSGANTVNGIITVGQQFAVVAGNDDAANILTIGTGGIANTANAMTFTGANGSTIKVSGVIAGTGSNIVTVAPNGGPFTLNLTGANTFSGNLLSANNTTILINGSGTVASVGALATRYGSTVTLDNTTTNVINRLGNGVNVYSSVGGGALNIIGNAAATSSETFKSFTPSGQTAITLTPAGQPVNLTLTATGGAFTHNAGTSVVLNGTNVISNAGTGGTSSSSFNTGAITAAANFQGAGTAGTTANQAIIPWMLLNNGGAISLPTATTIGANGFVRALGAGETTGAFVNTQNYGNGTPVISGTWLITSNVINTTNTAGLFVGQAVSSATGSGLPANAFITAINPGVSITISANTTAAQATAAGLTFTTAGTNINLTSASSGLGGTVGQAGTLTQTINSLTLGTGGSLTQPNSNTILTVAGTAVGGAILSTDSAASISGGQISGGGQELIFHTPSNLTVSSNIVGAGQTTKGESGNLTLSGTSFGTGQVNIGAGSLILNAGNNTIQFPVLVNINSGATLNLNGSAQLVTDVIADNTTGATGQGAIGSIGTVTSTGGTLTLKRDNTARQFTGNIGGTMGLVVSGQNTLTLTQGLTYTGPTLINTAGGTVTLQNNGALYAGGTTGSSSLTINRSTLALDNQGGALDSSTRLPSGLAISLGGGTLSLIGRQQATSAQTVGVVTATEGSNTLNATVQTTGVSTADLTLTGLVRTAGSTVNFTNTNGTLGTIGTNPRIFINGGANNTNTNGIIGGGLTVNGNDFAAYSPTYGVGALGTTGYQGYSPLMLNNAGSADNVSNGISTGVAIGSMTVNSLRATGTVNVVQTAGTTLTLASGGLLAGGGAIAIGTNFVNGTTFTNSINQGNVTSGGSELFLLGGTNSTINSAITGSGMAVVKSGSNTWTINGTNTYNGGTYVDQGTLTLGNAGNVTIGQSTLGTGGIFLNGGNLTQTAGSIIPSQAATITGSSTLTMTSDLAVANALTTYNSNTVTLSSVAGIHVGDLVSGTGIPANEFVTAVNPTTNQVTLTSGSGILNGSTNTLTFRNLSNTLSALTFNNNGGSNPTLANTGLLNLTSGTITASSNNVGGVSTASVNTLSGGNVDLNNVASPTITVNPISFNGQNLAPLQPTLIISSALQNANNAVSVTGGGNLQLSGASTFTGGVNLASGTSLTIAANSTNNATGKPLSGPLGQGTLTVGAGSTLLSSTGTFTVGNNVVVSGSFTFDAPTSAATNLTLGAGSQTISLPASTATTVTVNAPNMTGVFNDTVTGTGAILVKTGLGTLQLNNGLGANSTFSGGVVLNNGTLVASGVGGGTSALGTGPVVISGGALQLKHSGVASNGQIAYGNNVQINTALANAYIDVNNNGANTGNTINMGSLDYGTVAGTTFTSTVSGAAAPSTILNVTGGNNYKLQFSGTTLTSATSAATFNVGSGLTVILNGGATGFSATTAPVNVGPGTLALTGNNTFAAPTSISGAQTAFIYANQSTTPLGTGGITLNTGANLTLSALYSSSVSTTGYTTGGLSAKVYSTGAGAGANAANYGIAPGATLLGIQANDGLMRQAPAQITPGGTTNTILVYSGLLNITTAGTYNFGGASDDFTNLVIDGQLIQNQGVAQSYSFLPINLSAGAHVITLRSFNAGGGGTTSLYYNGPDTAANGITGLAAGANNYQALSLGATSYADGYKASNNYQNAAIMNNAITVAAAATTTVDGGGTDFNYGVPSLTLNGTSSLTVANGTGAAVGSLGNGVFVVTGLTTVSGAGATVTPTTGTLVLAGGVTDGGNGLTKTGQGNLILAGGGTFTGALNISGGFVQLQDGAALTTGTTTIGIATTTPATLDLNGQALTQAATLVLNGGAGPTARSSSVPAGLYNSSATTASFFTGSTMSLGAATATVNASVGGFGDIDMTNLAISGVAGNQLDKVGPNTVTFGNNNTFAGALNIKAGIAKITGANGFSNDTTNAVVESAGATIDLNGQTVTVAKPMTLNGTGLTGLGIPNQLGALTNSSATAATYPGNITLGGTTQIGGPSLQPGVNGDITLSGTFTGANQITKVGGNNLTLTSGTNATTLIDLNSGGVTLSGAGKIAGTGSSIVRQGTTYTLDNTGTAVSNRLLSSTSGGLFVTGTFVIKGNSTTAVSEIATAAAGNNINIGQANGIGGATITLNSAGTAGVTLGIQTTSTSIFNRGAFTTALLRGDNLGTLTTGTANASNIIGSTTSLGLGNTNGQSVGQAGVWNAPNAQIFQWALADVSATGAGTGFAGYNGYTSATAIAGTAGNVQGNVFGVSSIANNANNALAAAPSLSTMSANIPNNSANATITVASTAGLQVGQLVVGTNIPANAVIQSITNGTQFVITGTTGNTGQANNQQITIYANPTTTIASGNATTTAGSAVVNLTSGTTANLYAGEVVGSGTTIPVGVTIASIQSATQFTLSTGTGVTAGTAALTFGLPGFANINSTGATNSFGLSNAAQLVNSLTLNNASSVSNITTGLQLDSGAVLALQSATINSGNSYSYLTGSNTLNREMIFHTVGSGTTLTVNAPIFSNGSGLTKAGAGTMVLGTSEVYTGDTSINGGVLKLAGGQNTIFRPFTTAGTPGNAAAAVSGQNLTINFGGTLDLNGTNQAVANLRSGSGTQLMGGTVINSNGSPATLITGLSANQTWSGNISNGQSIGTVTGNTVGLTGSASGGTLNFVHSAGFQLIVNSPNTMSGALTVLGGSLNLTDLGTFQNASSVTISRASLIWTNTGTQAVSNRLSSTAPITLNGGGIQFVSRAGTGANPVDAISLGTVNLGLGASSINPTTVSQGGVSQMTFAGLGTVATGATLTFNGGNGAGFVLGENPKVFFTSAPTLTNGIIGGWATTSGVQATSTANGGQVAFATYDPATGIRQLQYTALNSFASGQNTLLNANLTLPAPVGPATTITTNSLTAINAGTLSFTNYNDKLVIQSGGFLEGNGNFALGSTTVPGQITAGSISNGGAATNNDLYFNVIANTVTVNSKIVDSGSGSMNVVFNSQSTPTNNSPTVTLTNANTYGGTTYISGVNLNLNSLVGPAIPNNVVLSGSNPGGTDSALDSQTQLNWQQPNQLNSTANITMIGATRLNLGNNAAQIPFQAVPNTQTINNLTITNDAGNNTFDGPTIFTGAGALTISGTITVNAATQVSTVPTINGFIVLSNATPTIDVAASQYSPNNVALAINANIALSGGATSITKTSAGYLGIGGQSHNLVGTTLNLNGGGLAWSPSTGTASAVLGSAVVMAANTTIDTRGNNQAVGYAGLVLGSVASSSSSAVIMNGVQGTAGNLTTGLDGSNTSFAGTFASPYPTGLLNVTKIGNTGTLSLTGNSQATASGTLLIAGGTVNLGTATGGGAVNFQTYTLQSGGSLVVDNSVTATSNRLGTPFFVTSNTLAPTARAFNMQGGNLTISGNSGAAVTEGLGVLGITAGGGIITLNAAGTAGVNVTLQSIGNQGGSTSLLLRGDGLGTGTGSGKAAVTIANTGAAGTPPGYAAFGGGGANNTLTRSIRPDILADSSATGLGQGFLTVDSSTGQLRPLGFGTGITFASELSPTLLTGTVANTNVSLASVAYGSSTTNMLLTGAAAGNYGNTSTLTLQSGGGINQSIIPNNPWGANGGLLTYTTLGGVLSLAGNNSISTGTIAYGATTTDYHVLAGSTLTLNAVPTGSTGGFVKADGGTLILNQPYTSNNAQTVTINGGTMQYGGTTSSFSTTTTIGTSATVPLGTALAVGSTVTGAGIATGTTVTAYNASTGAVTLSQAATIAGTASLSYFAPVGANGVGVNPLYVYINSGGVPSAENLAVNAGTLDLAGTNQLVGTVTSTNPLPFGGGTAGSPNIVITNTSSTTSTFSTNAAASVFSGVFSGNLNLDKSGNTTMTLSSPQTYTGTTNVRGGVLTLRDSATLASTTINANFATLIIDNTGLSSNNARISSTAAVNLTGGTLRLNQTSTQATQNFGTVTLNGGANTFVANQYSNNSNNSTGTFTINNLVVNNGSTFLYSTQGNGTFDASKNHLFLTNVNGAPYSASSLVNGIMGAQFVTMAGVGANSLNWATYSNLGGVTNPNTNIGGITTTNYGALGGGATVNANINANAQSVVGQTLNTLRIGDPAAATTLGMNGPTDQLVLAAGGLLVSNNANQGLAIQGGSLTGGAVNTASTLYLNVSGQNTLTINTPIVNNGATLSSTTGLWSGGSGALSLTRSLGNMTVTLTPAVVESLTTTQLPVSSTTITVPNSTGLFVGMAVSGSGITAGSTITGIAGNVITLSAATSATANAGTAQVTFAAAASAATSGTTIGTNTVTTAANSFATGFTPAVGMNIGGTNIPGGTTITGVSGTNASGFTLTLSQTALATSATNTFTVGAINNAYTGTTTINSSVDQSAGGTTNLSGVAGSVVIPGNLTINGGATVVMNTNQGQIAQSSAITINGSGALTLVGTNRFTPTLTFNNSGGPSAPTVTTGTLLDLGNATAINATNDNAGFTPLVTGGTVNFSSATGTTINVGGSSLNGLSIASAITTNTLGTTTPIAGAAITKTGTGSLILPNANAASLTWVLNGGSIFVGNATSLGTNASAGALSLSGNVGLASSVAANTGIALPTIFTGATNLSLANGFSGSGVNLSGAMNLNGQAPTLTVPLVTQTSTITGQITGTGGFSKAGRGNLTLTPGTASTFTGPVIVAEGLLVTGNANAFGGAGNNGADFTVGAAGELNTNAVALSIGSLSGGGIVTNSGAAAALTIGSGSNATNANFSGALVAGTLANLSLVKTGTNNQTLSGQSYYTGVTTVSGGTLTLSNGATGSLASTGNLATPGTALTAAQTPTLANTAITVGTAGANLRISTVGANAATQSTVTVAGTVLSGGVLMNTVNIGNTSTAAAGASVTLSAGTSFGFNTANTALSTLNIIGGTTAPAGLVLNGTSGSPNALTFNIGAGGADTIFVTKNATVTNSGGATITLNPLAGATTIPLGIIPLIESGGGFLGTGTNNFTLSTSTLSLGGHVYNLTLSGLQNTTTQTALNVTVQAPTNAYWSGTVDSNWNTGSVTGVTNWRTDATSNIDTQAIPTSASNVFFNTTTPTATNLTNNLAAPFSVASLTFTSAATSAVTIGDSGSNTNTLTVGASGITMNNTTGNHAINANVVLGANQSWTNNSTGVNTLTVNGSATAPSITGSGNNLTIAGTGNTVIAANIQTGSGTLTKTGTGTATLSGTSNTFTGATTVDNGTVAVTGSLSGTASVAVNTGGTLLLNSSTNANNIVNTTAPFTTNTSGTGGTGAATLTQGNTTAGLSNSFGQMTLNVNTTLDFSSGNTTLLFDSLNATTKATLAAGGGITLTVANWSGTSYAASIGDTGAVDSTSSTAQSHLLFTNDPGFGIGTFIPGINFTGYGAGAIEVAYAGGGYEIVPVPEPATTALIGSIALCALIGYRERRRFTAKRK